MTIVLEASLAGFAVLIVAYAGFGALLARTPLDKLHFLAPVTTLAVPLFSVAAIIAFGVSLGSATMAVIALGVALSGPAVTTAIGRTLADEQGVDVGESPE
ncbi:MAG: hypothetical protein HOQ07_09645 [Sinomonas sp.]|nr:hypothetical protein [Sinomonas sp.]